MLVTIEDSKREDLETEQDSYNFVLMFESFYVFENIVFLCGHRQIVVQFAVCA